MANEGPTLRAKSFDAKIVFVAEFVGGPDNSSTTNRIAPLRKIVCSQYLSRQRIVAACGCIAFRSSPVLGAQGVRFWTLVGLL